jgi:hypothetical protein
MKLRHAAQEDTEQADPERSAARQVKGNRRSPRWYDDPYVELQRRVLFEIWFSGGQLGSS